MKRIVFGECTHANILSLTDPDEPNEAEFEYYVAKVLSCLYQDYHCILFSGCFTLDLSTHRPDLALVAKDYSHWFVVEVELLSHSFEGHVLPQVKCFVYGAPQDDCTAQLSKNLEIDLARAKTLVSHVPYTVVVVANGYDHTWDLQLKAHNIQFLHVAKYSTVFGGEALELSGSLDVTVESLGFGIYLATDRSVRFTKSIRLPDGLIQISDMNGVISHWFVERDLSYAWVTKKVGSPSIPNNSHVQLVRTVDGRIRLIRPS